MIRVFVSIDDGKERKSIANGLTDESLQNRELMLSEVTELMSVLLDTVEAEGLGPSGLGKQAREELARREAHEKEVRGG